MSLCRPACGQTCATADLPAGSRHSGQRADSPISRISRSMRRALTTLTAQFGVDPRQAVSPPPHHANSTDMAPQLGFCLGALLDDGNRMQPSMEAADIDADDPAQHRKVGEVFKSEPGFAASLVRMLDCAASIYGHIVLHCSNAHERQQ
jgi:hypothetical protein